ncbi:Dps family protein (plasmid) [Pseudonocardia bannensis]|uniref:DNA starvation/stationary phase protection protein n=1 Tax=Pseudonocardia bannensis TaxID=630973 RepID=A0A848DPV6_9PSEU|nr:MULTISPECIES: DNA starvation/stationary phase protection protein [Pseudonocardia]NMH94867.1 DNA starvation/stationary phase protection protein [Pseudonocardia bannensis]
MAEPIPSILDDQARNTIGAALQATLVDLIDLSLEAKQAHWNLVGRQFRDVHEHLDELVDVARKYSDQVAERAAAVGVPPDGRTATVAGQSGIPAFNEGWVKDRDVIRQISESVDVAVRRIRPRIQETETADLVTQDLFIEISRQLEQTRWMWQAQNAGYQAEQPAR